jgi:hypothetical protein
MLMCLFGTKDVDVILMIEYPRRNLSLYFHTYLQVIFLIIENLNG